MTYSKSSNREREMTYSKSSKRERAMVTSMKIRCRAGRWRKNNTPRSFSMERVHKHKEQHVRELEYSTHQQDEWKKQGREEHGKMMMTDRRKWSVMVDGSDGSSRAMRDPKGRGRGTADGNRGGTVSVGVAAASMALMGLVLVPAPAPSGFVVGPLPATAATEELSPAQKLAERKRMMQERVQKAAQRGTSANGPTPTPTPTPTPGKEKAAAPQAKQDAKTDATEESAPAASTPAPKTEVADVEPEQKLERSKFEAPSPGEVSEQRRKLLQEKLERSKAGGTEVVPSSIDVDSATM